MNQPHLIRLGLCKQKYVVDRGEQTPWHDTVRDIVIPLSQFQTAIEKLPKENSVYGGYLFRGGIVEYSYHQEWQLMGISHETEEGLLTVINELGLPQPKRILRTTD